METHKCTKSLELCAISKKKKIVDSYRKFIGFKTFLNMLTFKLNFEPKYILFIYIYFKYITNKYEIIIKIV